MSDPKHEGVETIMTQFEYEITSYPADAFKEVIYFCSSEGKCNMEKIPSNQITRIQTILNEHGQAGWELVHIAFGKDGILVFWKRMIKDRSGREIEGKVEVL